MVTLPPEGSFLDADRIVGGLGILPGSHVADLGCGSGFFTIAMAKAVGKEGTVIAVDVMAEPLESVQARAEGAGLKNVHVVRADLEVLGGTKIPDNSQDVCLLKNILFQSKKQGDIIAEAARITKPGGRVVVIDWKKGAGGFGPPDEIRTDEEAVRSMGQAAGLRPESGLSADNFHFEQIFVK